MQVPVWLVSVAWVFGGVLVGALIGLAVDLILVPRIRAAAQRHGWHFQAALATSLRGMPEVWGALIGMAAVPREKAFWFPDAWEPWTNRIWQLALVISLTIFAVRISTALIRTYVTPAESKARSGSIFLNLIKFGIWSVGLVFALGVVGVQIGPLVATLGVTGIAISLGLQDTLANLFNGLQITLTRQLETGHYVRLQSGEEGEVIDVNWRDTKLRTGSGDVVIVPNSVVGRTALTNYTRGQEQHISAIPFSVKAGADLDRVAELGVEVARHVQKSSAEAVAGFEPTCRVTDVTGDAATFVTRIQVVSYRQRGILTDEYLRAVQSRLRAEGLAQDA